MILQELEAQEQTTRPAAVFSDIEPEEEPLQMSFRAAADDEILAELKNIDTDTLTPLEALTTLHQLVRKARNDI